jgi:hypothetical protein
MRHLLAVSLLALTGCSYVGLGLMPGDRISLSPSSPGPVTIRVGKPESTPLENPETPKSESESSTAEASDSPGATQ